MGLDVWDWWQSIDSEYRLLVYVAAVSLIVAEAFLQAVSDLAIDVWGGLVIYGILSMIFGGTEIAEGITGHHVDEDSEIVGTQLLMIVAAGGALMLGKFLRIYAESFTNSLSEFQILGAIILLSRGGLLLMANEGISYGKWSKSVFTLGATLVVVPFLTIAIPLPGRFDEVVAVAIAIFLTFVASRVDQEELDLP